MVKITLTDEQFKEVKKELIEDFRYNVKDYIGEFIDEEFDLHDVVIEQIENRLEENVIYDNLDKIIDDVDKDKLIKMVTDKLMERLSGW